MTFQRDQQVYGVSVGTTSTNATYVASRDPNVNDINFPIGKFWQNTTNESLWYLNSFSSSQGFVQAAWINIESSIATLSDTADTPVSASSGLSTPPNNIQLTSLDGSVTILSDPPNNRIEFSTTASGGSSLVFLQSQTAAASTSLSFTTGIGSPYTNYLLICSNFSISGSGLLNIRLSTNSGVSYIATSYLGGNNFTSWNNTIETNSNSTTEGILGSSSSTSQGLVISYLNFPTASIPNITSTYSWANVKGQSMTSYNGGNITPNAFQLFPSAGTFTGKATLYGIRES